MPAGAGASETAGRRLPLPQRLIYFHAFRHNVTTILANVAGLSQGWIDEIVGHSRRRSTG
jgi:integrase